MGRALAGTSVVPSPSPPSPPVWSGHTPLNTCRTLLDGARVGARAIRSPSPCHCAAAPAGDSPQGTMAAAGRHVAAARGDVTIGMGLRYLHQRLHLLLRLCERLFRAHPVEHDP